MDIEIQKLNINNIPDYMRVNTQCWQETYKGIIDDEFLNKINNELEKNIERKMERFKSEEEKKDYVIYLNKKPIGMTSVGKSRIDKYPNSGELCSLYILNDVKDKGIGKKIFEHDVCILKKLGYDSMVIGCLKDNISANGFYQHMGGKLSFERTINIGGKEYKENIYYFEKI